MGWTDYFFFFEKIGSRYMLVAGIAFLLFYILLQKKISHKKIQTRQPLRNDYIREIGFSLLTISIFAVIILLIVKHPLIRPASKIYTSIAQLGWLYFFLAFIFLAIIHDTYFYWTHRLMHNKSIFKYFHLVHHKSTNPSPWAAYAFHPLEAIVEAGVFPIMVFLIPVHPLHIAIFFFFMIVYNVYGHLGYEIYPRGFSRHWLGKWINTSVNHNLHHQYFKGNYGLYFLFWDRLMGTVRKDYDERFDEVKSRVRE
ncbi:MAG: sterol desaturase family protein [Gemmatimonadaceae bacterium]|nr:sterol desaturase family protein [Chitinophagaceae bacterium]